MASAGRWIWGVVLAGGGLAAVAGCGDDGAASASGGRDPGTGAAAGSAAQGGAAGGGGFAGPGGAGGSGGVEQAPNANRLCNDVAAVTEQYGLPPPTSLPNGVTFLSDWQSSPIAGAFDGVQAMDACRYQLDPSFHTWHGKLAARVEVNPGDDPISSGAERTEVLVMQDGGGAAIEESSASGLQFYATSYYFPASWDGTFLQGNADSWSTVVQFHPSGASGYFDGMQAGRRTDGGAQKLWFNTYEGDLQLGRWVDLVFHMDWSTGELKLYRRDQGETKFVEVLSTTDPSMVDVAPTYFKQGLYRGPDVNGRTDVLWVGPTSRGPSFAAVEQASFGTSDGF